ncbi:hypothetical protein PENTCL1PPCAC_28598, partial [Pristionchus entomophagus]
QPPEIPLSAKRIAIDQEFHLSSSDSELDDDWEADYERRRLKNDRNLGSDRFSSFSDLSSEPSLPVRFSDNRYGNLNRVRKYHDDRSSSPSLRVSMQRRDHPFAQRHHKPSLSSQSSSTSATRTTNTVSTDSSASSRGRRRFVTSSPKDARGASQPARDDQFRHPDPKGKAYEATWITGKHEPIRPEKFHLPAAIAKARAATGIVFLRVLYSRKQVLIYIDRAEFFSVEDARQNRSTFVQVEMICGSRSNSSTNSHRSHSSSSDQRSRMTDVIENTDQPEFKQPFSFDLNDDSVDDRITISAIEEERIGQNRKRRKPIGCFTFPLIQIFKKAKLAGCFDDFYPVQVIKDGYFLLDSAEGYLNNFRMQKIVLSSINNTDGQSSSTSYNHDGASSSASSSIYSRDLPSSSASSAVDVPSVPAVEEYAAYAAEKKLKKNKLGKLSKMISSIGSKLTSAISTSTVSFHPSKEEVLQWEHSFNALIAHDYGRTLFAQFLGKSHASENLDFWIECETFRQMETGSESTTEKAKNIYKEFIAVCSSKWVNIDSETLASVNEAMERGCGPDTFSGAQNKIEELMRTDNYPRFLKDQIFMDVRCRCVGKA